MALIAMAVYSTAENKREEILRRCLESVCETVNWTRHRIGLSVNAATEESVGIISAFAARVGSACEIIYNAENLGTARAVNKIWIGRNAGEHAVKMDDDVLICQPGWADHMEEAIFYDSQIGIVGLKRKDCWEYPGHPDPFYRSTPHVFQRAPGHPWIVIERVRHVMGTCQMYNAALLDKIGYLYQPGLYGWDDVIAAARSEAAGFYNYFLPYFRIDHIDDGTTPYQEWKGKRAWADRPDIDALRAGYENGSISVFYGPNGEHDEQTTTMYVPRDSWDGPNLKIR